MDGVEGIKNMRKAKKIIIYMLLFILIILFFLPKGMGIGDGSMTVSKEYKCFGYKIDWEEPGVVDIDGDITEREFGSQCFGIVYGTRCEVEHWAAGDEEYCETKTWRGVLKDFFIRGPRGACFRILGDACFDLIF